MILILEDDAQISGVLKLYFGLCFPIEVKMITSISEARQFLKTKPDVKLVLTDFYLGNDLATDLITDIRALPSKPKLIIMSGMSEPHKVLQGVDRDGFIPKPFSIDVVARQLKRFMGRKRKNQETSFA